MQTPAATICGAHGAAFTPCPRRPTPPGSLRKPFTGSSRRTPRRRLLAPMASTVDSPGSSSDFTKRIERAWLISQQPRPVSCSSCQSAGHVECKWCAGTGFFILGDNILCEVPSRNSKCVICSGKGFTSCADCQGTGFRAKWLEEPPIDK
ncbi:tsi1-interacting protein TSIP1 [Zea mays]|uniref:Tsi1-interacting protein TSIP1 n=2 Tax=Zea mays TaxID=4577 RepID=B6UEF0_MAIZE|nr:tsi1-interacting protein TSIP1 [Zea mays]ACG47733.1 tsi1-interacting protein TSIP1 [Zea mays]|eukprot:NP_001152460.1 tsi1-interacting protein TSIP1 [Zea mays]